MEKQQSKPTSNNAVNFALFSLLITIFCISLGMFMMSRWPNLNGAGMVILTALCGFPLALLLFIALRTTNKIKKPYKRFLFPALMIPLISGLLIGWTLIQQSPRNIFKLYVMDPIPTDVTDIHARDISNGFDNLEIIVSFRATPEAIDEIITFNELNLVEDIKYEDDPPLEQLPETNWNRSWILYKRESFGTRNRFIFEMWVNPQKDTAIFHLLGDKLAHDNKDSSGQYNSGQLRNTAH